MKLNKILKMIMGSKGANVNIDGRDFSASKDIVINGQNVWVDGVKQEGTLIGDVKIIVNGDVEVIDGAVASVEVTGECHTVKTMSGSVSCGDVKGNVSTMSGSVRCGEIGGSVSTMSGNINRG